MHLDIYTDLNSIINHRKGEVKLGERFKFLSKVDLGLLKFLKKRGVKFAILGIPESIGVLANHGLAGSENSWKQFIFQFANLQNNRFLDGSSILCLGQVQTKDLQIRAFELTPDHNQYYTKLRSLCQELDQRVSPVIELLSSAGIIPIVIGGGHNNAFPVLRGMAQGLASDEGINCLNLDAHADFRPLEGRHSGNGFSYAFYQKYLHRYYVLGLNEGVNSEAMLKNLDLEEGVGYELYRAGEKPDMSKAIKFLEGKGPVGLEIDLDVINFMPTSAYSVSGFNLDQVRVIINNITPVLQPVYLHLTEGQINGQSREGQMVSKALATLVQDFIKSYSR